MPIKLFSTVFDEVACRKLIRVVDEVCKHHADEESSEYRLAVAQLVLRMAERDGVDDPDRLTQTLISMINRANQISPATRGS